MSTILTLEAYQGFIADNDNCPYIETSPSAMAWYLGRHFAAQGYDAPTPRAGVADGTRIAVTMGRGDTLNIRGRKDVLLHRFEWKPGNKFRSA